MNITKIKLFYIKIIKKISLTLTVFSGVITPNEYQIQQINLEMLDIEVSVEGVVVNIKEYSKMHTYFLEIMDNSGEMNVVIFDKEAEDFEKNNIKINNLIKRRIKVLGTVTEYNGSLELILKDSKSLKIIA